ncbi:MAG: O-methyltransferase [Deltaproteobacteria bacterium]
MNSKSTIVEHPEEYFRQWTPERDPLLLGLEEEARREEIPIIGPVAGTLLAVLTVAVRATKVLELGTAIGYSAIFLGRACKPCGGQVMTVDNDPAMAARARVNLRKTELTETVSVREGEALRLLPEIPGPFDLVFMDIDKEQYAPALGQCERLLRPGGLLAVDNTAFPESDAFNRALADSPAWHSVQLYSFLPLHSPEKDGFCLALRL